MRLDAEAAEPAIADRVAAPLDLSVVQAAWGIREVLCSRMADLLRQVTIERGHDPRDFTHVRRRRLRAVPCDHARQGTRTRGDRCARDRDRTVGVRHRNQRSPRQRGTKRVPARTRRERAGPRAAGRARSGTRGRVGSGRRCARATAARRTNPGWSCTLAVRYRGQLHHLEVPFASEQVDAGAVSACLSAFEQEYETLFGKGAAFPEAGFEIVSVRADGIGTLSAHGPGRPRRAAAVRSARGLSSSTIPSGHSRPRSTRGRFPAPGESIDGPALVEFPGHTVVVHPGWTAELRSARQPHPAERRMTGESLDPVSYEVIRNRLVAITDEMRVALQSRVRLADRHRRLRLLHRPVPARTDPFISMGNGGAFSSAPLAQLVRWHPRPTRDDCARRRHVHRQRPVHRARCTRTTCR